MGLNSGLVDFIYEGKSMATVFRPGQLIRGNWSFDIRAGSVYVFEYEGELTVHRLIKVKDDLLFFKGDFGLIYEQVNEKMLLAKIQGKFDYPLLILSRLYSKSNPKIIRVLGKGGLLLFSKIIRKPL